MATAFKLNEMINIALAPAFIRNAVLDELYEEDSSYAVAFDAALKLLNKRGVNRGELHEVVTCNGINEASIIGKFVIVEQF